MEENLKAVQQVLEQVNKVMLDFLAKGHVLLEDIPGVGKTTMAVAFSRTMLLVYPGCASLRPYRVFHIPERRGKYILSKMPVKRRLLYYLQVSLRQFSL